MQPQERVRALDPDRALAFRYSWAGVDPLVFSVVDKFAAKKRLDLAWVEGLRKDFLTLVKNLPLVKNYATAHRLREALRVYRKRFDDLLFENFLNRDLKYNMDLSEGDVQWYNKRLRSVAWSFSSELSSMPIGFVDDYNSEESLFLRFEQEAPKWKARVQRKALDFWKAMKEVIQEFEEFKKRTIDVRVPSSDRIVLEGFRVEVRGFEDDEEAHSEYLAVFKEGLKTYKQRASRVAPILLQKQCPIVLEFNSNLDKGGEYNKGVIICYMTSTTKGPDWVAHLLAHEMGHHLWRTVLGASAQTFWDHTIRGDYGDLDLKELLNSWPGDTWAFQFPEKMKDTDPVLALQVQALSYDRAYGEIQTKEDFQRLYDQGTRTVRVPKHPITGYANKNPEEAFCETIGLLVAYGPRAVHERVQMWFDTAIPGALKLASLEARIVERYTASV